MILIQSRKLIQNEIYYLKISYCSSYNILDRGNKLKEKTQRDTLTSWNSESSERREKTRDKESRCSLSRGDTC